MISIISSLVVLLASLVARPITSIRLVWEGTATEPRAPSGSGRIRCFLVHNLDPEHARRWLWQWREAEARGETVKIDLLDTVVGVVSGEDPKARYLASMQATGMGFWARIGKLDHPWIVQWLSESSSYTPENAGQPSSTIMVVESKDPHHVMIVFKYPWKKGLKDRSWYAFCPAFAWRNALERLAEAE